jgi:hypothetical protein
MKAIAIIKKRNTSRGAATIEAALISLTFILLIFSIFEYGTFSRDYLAANDGVINGVREGAAFGSRTTDGGLNGDMAVIQSIRSSTGVLPIKYIDRIIIWKANPNSILLKEPPKVCLEAGKTSDGGYVDTSVFEGLDSAAGSASVRCNIYASKTTVTDRGSSFPILDAFFRVQERDVDYFTCGQYNTIDNSALSSSTSSSASSSATSSKVGSARNARASSSECFNFLRALP